MLLRIIRIIIKVKIQIDQIDQAKITKIKEIDKNKIQIEEIMNIKYSSHNI